MEDENIVNTEKQSSLIPALSLLGLGLGVVAFALGIMAMVKVGDTAKDMNDKIEKAASLSLETKKISDRVDSLALQIEEIKSDKKTERATLVSQLNEEFRKINNAINDTRKSLAETNEVIQKLAARPSAVKTVKRVEVPAENSQEQTSTQQSGQKTSSDVKKHVIESGDTFGKLAKKYGVSINAIMTANPDANPSRLRIGQEIVIP